MTPARRLLWLLGAWAVFGLAASIWPSGLRLPWWLCGGLIAVIAGVDLVWVLRRPPPQVERHVPGTLPVGVWCPVTLILHNPTRHPLVLQIFDHSPPELCVEGQPATLILAANGRAQLRYRVQPQHRGTTHFKPCQLGLRSPLGLWWRNHRVSGITPVRIYPNFAQVTKYALLAHDRRQGQMGIKRYRRRGEGLEFHQLREYRIGDSLRQIDWKATSRTRKLISRDYQDERDQRVVFLLDSGRRMRAEDGSLNHFDHTLNAVLLLAYIAVRQGDAVGLMSFAGEEGQQRWLAPRKGMATVNQILNTVYDLQPGLQVADYSAAAIQLLVRQKKRALVVVLTNLRDEDSDDLLPALALLRQRHLVLLASLRETVIDQTLGEPVEDFEHALTHAGAHQYLDYRTLAHTTLRHHGVLTLDARPDHLPIALANRYLAIKGSGLL